MDTNSIEFKEALNELVMAVSKVLRLANGGLTAEQQMQQVAVALNSLLATTGTAFTVSAAEPTRMVGTDKTENTILRPDQAAVQAPTSDHVALATLYAEKVIIRDTDGEPGFRIRNLTSTKDESTSVIEIHTYSDSEADFVVLPTFKRADADDRAIASSGDGSRPALIAPGTLRLDGKYWMVISPCKVDWK